MKTVKRRLLAIITFALLLLVAAGAQAQQSPAPKSPFGVGPSGSERGVLAQRPAPQAAPAGPLQRIGQWVIEKQAQINRELATAVRRLKTAHPMSATLTLAFLSFAYGILHAAGPGHGKAVISSYVLADGRTVRRGVLLAFLAAGVQALSALVLVAVLVLVLSATGLQIKATEGWLETASWGLVALVGAWLLFYQLRAIFAPAASHAHYHGASPGHGHHHHHHHDQDASCEVCAHVPRAQDLQGDWSWPRALALAFAVGVRPCTGAILVLVFAIGQGLLWAGIFSTFAMALGTAITVSVLAASAVGFRELAKRLAGGGTSKWAERIQTTAGLAGASLVLALGVAFFFASLSTAQPF